MTELEDLVPAHEPAKDVLAFAGKAAVSLVPLVGPLAAESLGFALERRQSQRQYEFNVEIARALTAVVERIDEGTALDDIVGSDEFIAVVTRAQRAASETASHEKRRRLASAVANGGSWAPFSATEREQFTRLVEDFSALHIWLLQYFTDPAGWLAARDLGAQYSNVIAGGITGPLEAALGSPQHAWQGAVAQAAADLDRNGLASIPLTTMMTGQGIVAPRTSDKGRRFLTFMQEPHPLSADPPEVL